MVKEGKEVTFKQRLFPGGTNEINEHKSYYNNKNPRTAMKRESLILKSQIILNSKQIHKHQTT